MFSILHTWTLLYSTKSLDESIRIEPDLLERVLTSPNVRKRDTPRCRWSTRFSSLLENKTGIANDSVVLAMASRKTRVERQSAYRNQ